MSPSVIHQQASKFHTMASKLLHISLLVSLLTCVHKIHASSKCYQPDTIDYSLRRVYCDQPLFVNFLPKTAESELLDNICYTVFPLPDDPNTFTVYESRVFCDGSSDVSTFVATDFEIGQIVDANPFVTLRDSVIGYAGCDTYVVYRCFEFGVSLPSFVLGFSPKCEPIGLSCLRKVQEIINDRCLPEDDYYVLPMKLPNRCVTQQLCLQPPNPFYNKLPSVALY